MDDIRERLERLGTFNGRMQSIYSELDALKGVNTTMIDAMSQAAELLDQLRTSRIEPNELIELLNGTSQNIDTNVNNIITRIQGAPNLGQMNQVIGQLQRAIEAVPSTLVGGYSYKPYTSYNSKRPGSYKVSMKKGKKKYSKRKKRMTK